MKTTSALTSGFLIALGSLQMVGDVFGTPRLKALAAATQVAPAMKVFTAHQGYETHAARFTVHWQDEAGTTSSLLLDPKTYRGVEGPYNRRNVYGAALACGPVLRSDPRTRALQESVMRYAFCAPGALRDELDIPRSAQRFSVNVAPTRADARRDLDLTFSVACHALWEGSGTEVVKCAEITSSVPFLSMALES